MSFQNFNDKVPLSSPRSLLVCKRNGIDPMELLDPSEDDIRQRLLQFPEEFKEHAKEALEQDRAQIIKHLLAEYETFSLARVEPAEFVAFPELEKLWPYQPETPEIQTPNTVARQARLESSQEELSFIKTMADKLQESEKRFEAHYQEISQQRRHQLEMQQEERDQKMERCLNAIATKDFERNKTGYLEFRQYDAHLGQHKQSEQQELNLRRVTLIREYIQKEQKIQDHRRKESAERSKQREYAIEEYHMRIEMAEERRLKAVEEQLETRNERSKLSEMRVREVQEDYESILEAEKEQILAEFEQKCEQHEEVLAHRKEQIAMKNSLSMARHKERFESVEVRRAEEELMKENRLRLQREMARVKELQELSKTESAEARTKGLGTLENELRDRRFRRLSQQQAFERYVVSKNNEIEQERHEEMEKAANEYKQELIQSRYAEEKLERQKLAETQEKRFDFVTSEISPKTATRTNVESIRQKVLVADYLSDEKCIRQGFVEIRGWKEDV